MNGETDNLQVVRWTDDPAEREKFLTEVALRIDRAAKFMAHRYGVEDYWQDIASEVRIKLLQEMRDINTDGPFTTDSPREAAAFFLDKKNFRILEWARLQARKIAGIQSRQAELLADVFPQPDLLPDNEKQCLAIARGIPRIFSEVPKLTARDKDILRMEMLLLSGVDELPARIAAQAAQAAGTSSSKLLAYSESRKQYGRSESDRKALYRARAKVSKGVTPEKFKSLFVIVFALSLALYAIHQDRSVDQNHFVNQGCLIHQPEVSRQGNLIHQPEVAHQGGNLIHQPEVARQGLVIINRDPTA